MILKFLGKTWLILAVLFCVGLSTPYAKTSSKNKSKSSKISKQAKSSKKSKNKRKKRRKARSKRSVASVKKTSLTPRQKVIQAVKRVKLNRSMAPIPIKRWYKNIEYGLPRDLCQPQEYFMACYQVSQKQCRSTLKREINTCWGRKSVNWRMRRVRPRLEGVSMAYEIGACAGTSYEKRLKKKFKKIAACQGSAKWMGRTK